MYWFERHTDHTCMNCHTTKMQQPPSGHPAYVECPNCGAIELTYEPQEYQNEFHSAPYTKVWDERQGKWTVRTQIIGVFGGYGSAKSRATLEEVLLRCLENPNGTTLFTAPTLQQLKRTTLKTWFNEICPPPLIDGYNKSDGEITLYNGHVIYTIPSDDEEKIRSINAGIIHMEEASGIKRSIYDQCLTRIRDPFVSNKLFCVCSNPDLGWIKDVFVDNEKRFNPQHPEHNDYNESITCFIWETALNKYLPVDFIEMNSKGKPEWWIKRFMKGSFEHSEGMVYPNWMSTVIPQFDVFTPDKRHWWHYITHDHGLRNPTSVGFHCIDPDKGIVYRYAEYYVAGKTVPEHAKAIKPLIDRIPVGRMLFMRTDPASLNKTDPVNGKSVQGLYAEYNIFWMPANNNIEAGILRVNAYIESGKFKIMDNCVNTIREGIYYRFPEESMDNADKNLDEKPIKAKDHAMDDMRYGVMALPEDPAKLILGAFEPPMNYNGSKESEYGYDDEDENDFSQYSEDWTSYC